MDVGDELDKDESFMFVLYERTHIQPTGNVKYGTEAVSGEKYNQLLLAGVEYDGTCIGLYVVPLQPCYSYHIWRYQWPVYGYVYAKENIKRTHIQVTGNFKCVSCSRAAEGI